MTRKLKTLGTALVAVFAMSAVAASAASAAEDMFTAEVGTKLTLTGTQEGAKNIKFKVVGQTVECGTATFAGSSEGVALKQVTGIVPTYGGCEIAGVPATIDTNGCKYGFYNTTDAAGDGLVKIEGCEAGKHMTITITGLTGDITVNPANEAIAEGVRYTNIGMTTTREITIDLTAKPKIVVDTWPEGSVNATTAAMEPATTGRLTGQITITATSGGVHRGIFAS